ncbi:nucleotide-diphospho-sugar transferase [Halenospora varia]|nr:nucleotide-diphospho-sugar transferase [Halenospora varia]
MAIGYRYYVRRLKHVSSSPTVQGIFICVCLFFCIRWVLEHNHDDVETILPASARPTTTVDDPSIDWSKLAYVQYATSPEYLCNALMIWSEIEELGTLAQKVLMYPSHWDPNEIDDIDPGLRLTPIARLLQSAVEDYNVTLHPVSVLHQNHTSQATWADSYTKLLAFNLTSYSRVLTLDSDSVVLQNLDELFLLPSAPLAMPYVYWGQPTNWGFSSQLLLLQPSTSTFEILSSAIKKAKPDEYDMDILTRLPASLPSSPKILRIPQNPYNLLSGEFRRSTHSQYLSSLAPQDWDPDSALRSAKFLHFSDWPIPKPWVRSKKDVLNKYMPKCRQKEWFGATDCRDREIWLRLYFEFAMRRKRVCGGGFELQDQSLPLDSVYRHGRWYHPGEMGES